MYKPKAVFIGPANLVPSLEKAFDDWDFVRTPKNIKEFWDDNTNAKIPEDTDIVLSVDAFFDPTGEDKGLEQCIATLSPYCFFALLQYKKPYQEQIVSRVNVFASSINNETDPIFFFVPRERVHVGMDKAVEEYLNSPLAEKSVVAHLQGKEYVPEEETETEDDIQQPTYEEENYGYNPDEDEDEGDYLGQVVAVTSSKGGSGKSSVSMLLSTYLSYASEQSVAEGLAERPLKIILVDLDVRDGQVGFLTNNAKPTVLKMRTEGGINDTTFSNTKIYDSRLKIDLLLAPKKPRLAENTPPEFYLELIQFLKKRYDYVILDTSVNYTDPLLERVAYPVADQIIFVTDIVETSILSMARWILEVTNPKERGGMGISRQKIGIVVNKALSNVSMSGEKISRASQGLPILTAIPNNAKLIAYATNMHQMHEVLRQKDIRLSIMRLANRVTGNKYRLSRNFEM